MSVAESQVATLKDGDYFGKNALLRGEPRTATIKAKTDLSTFKITRTEFEELGLREKLDFPQRKAVGGGAVGERQLKPPSPRTPEERRLMLEALTDDVNLQKCVPLDGPKMHLLMILLGGGHLRVRRDHQGGGSQCRYFYIERLWVLPRAQSYGFCQFEKLVKAYNGMKLWKFAWRSARERLTFWFLISTQT